jgi:hypothetical protein
LKAVALHRPTESQQSTESEDDPEEAVKMAIRGLKEGLDSLVQPPTHLSPEARSNVGRYRGSSSQRFG